MGIKNQVQLITYPNSLGGDLKNLKNVLDKYFSDIFNGGIHILPPFPSSGDRGFAPLTYLEIAPEHGSWEDIRKIGERYNIMLDLMVNHISRRSFYFEDFLKNGKKSEYADMFITPNKIWPDGKISEEDVKKIHLRRPRPFSEFPVGDMGEKVSVWTTFGQEDPSEQIDIDVNANITKKILQNFLQTFRDNNVQLVRLDAVGYITKIAGTSCFFVEPCIYDFIDWMHGKAKEIGVDLLPEVHSHYSVNFKLADHGCYAYDFTLPYLILNTLIHKTSTVLLQYINQRPDGMITMLDCHDGIPVKPDLEDLYISEEAKAVVKKCVQNGANLSLLWAEDQKDADGFAVHQIACTYYSALDCNDDAYIASRALQFFVPGIPQVYYVGLLAGENDYEAVERTGEGREINRHNYSLEEIEESLEKTVVKRLLDLIRFRNTYPAFNGEFKVIEAGSTQICLSWQLENKLCTLSVNLATYVSKILYMDECGEMRKLKI